LIFDLVQSWLLSSTQAFTFSYFLPLPFLKFLNNPSTGELVFFEQTNRTRF